MAGRWGDNVGEDPPYISTTDGTTSTGVAWTMDRLVAIPCYHPEVISSELDSTSPSLRRQAENQTAVRLDRPQSSP
jgi:hypothetical protein